MDIDYQNIRDTFESAFVAGCNAINTTNLGTHVIGKGGGDYATAVDLASSKAIAQCLKSSHPEIPHLDEEDPDSYRFLDSEFVFVSDPLDGTLLFKNGGNGYGINLLLLHHGVPVVSLMGQPALGRVFTAIRGRGAFAGTFSQDETQKIRFDLHAFRIKETLVEENEGLLLAIPLSHGANKASKGLFNKLYEVDGLVGNNASFGCAVANSAEVCNGPLHAYVNLTGGTVYDLGAPQLYVQEAGGFASTFTGEDIVWDEMKKHVVFAKNEAIARRILSAAA